MPAPVAPFLAVVGSTNLDVLLRVKELPKPGQSTPVIQRSTARGGHGANLAAHAGSLGVPVRLASRVGPDFPVEWRSDLLGLGTDLTFLEATATATPTCFVFTDLLDRQSFAIDHALRDGDTWGPDPAVATGLARGGWVHLCAGDPVAQAPVAAAAKSAGVLLALDPGQELAFRHDARSLAGLLAFCDTFFANEAELREACRILSCATAEDLLAHVPLLVVTRGSKGASLYRRGQPTVHAPAHAVDRVADPTGAGDAFRAGWYAALAQGADAQQALRWGQAAGAAKTRHVGAQEHLLTRDDLRAFLGTMA